MGNFMENTTITVSARSLAALLGGEIELQDFRDRHKIPTNNGTPPTEPLRRVLEEGRAFVDVKLESMPGEDDDNVVLTFGKADPAKVKFQAPGRL